MERATKRWGGLFKSRTDQRVENNLGIIKLPALGEVQIYRNKRLHKLDSYYEGTQYQKLRKWDDCEQADGTHIPVRQRQPRLMFNFAKVFSQRVATKLIGHAVWPAFKIEEDPDTQDYIDYIIRGSQLRGLIIEPIRRMLNSSSVFVRFYAQEGVFVIEHYSSKYCYPVLKPNGDLESIEIRYVYDDPETLDDKGNPVKRWYKLGLGQYVDILYDNPIYHPNVEPLFIEVDIVEHGIGFVQGEWFRTSHERHSEDGYSIIEDITGFIDELNYSFSQSSQAVAYNQDPQLVLKNMTEDEIEELIRSSTKAWNLGREGDAQFLESSLNGVQAANDFRDKIRLGVQDIARVVLMDPEKMVAHAQSGRALEVLHGPMIDLINELRPMVERRLINLVQKMALTNLILAQRGEISPVAIPPGYTPLSLDITLRWPPIFQQTTEDLQKKVMVATTLTNASIFSREWAANWLAQDFGVEDVEAELAKVAAQPVINPFAAF